MKAIFLAALIFLALAGAARADMYPDASNAKLPDARNNMGFMGSSITTSGPCYAQLAGNANCGVYMNMLDDPATSANIGLSLNVTSSHAPPNADFNFRYRTALMPSIDMKPGSTSVWAINAGIIVEAGVDLTGKTANGFELDIHNRAQGVGDAAGAAGITFTDHNVTGISITGSGFRSTYALDIGGAGSIIPTTVTTAGTSTTFSTGGNNFAAGDQIRVIVGSATKGMNGTPGVGHVTAATGVGPQALTVVWETASPGSPGVGDWVLAMGQYPAVAPSNTDVIFNRGIGCLNSIIKSCFYVYSPVEIGVDFQGSATNIGVDFAKMTGLQPGTPTDIRLGLGHRVSMYAAGAADLPVITTAGIVGAITQLHDGSGNAALALGGTGASTGFRTNFYRNDAHEFQNRDGSVTFAIFNSIGLNLPAITTVGGPGGLYVCVDSTGNTYKKASCP